MDRSWFDRADALSRFNAWEARQLVGTTRSYAIALAWLSEAWEVADRYGVERDAVVARNDHLRDLLNLRMALERARLTP